MYDTSYEIYRINIKKNHRENMELHEKLGKYFVENGVQKKWFAKKMGISPQLFYCMLNGQQKLTSRLWRNLIEMTGGYITLGDILKYELKNIEWLIVSQGDRCDKCEVSIKDYVKRV